MASCFHQRQGRQTDIEPQQEPEAPVFRYVLPMSASTFGNRIRMRHGVELKQTRMHSACNMSVELLGHAVHRYGALNTVCLERTVAIAATGAERNAAQDRRLERQTTSALEQRLSYGSEATQSLPLPVRRDSSQMSLSGVFHVQVKI